MKGLVLVAFLFAFAAEKSLAQSFPAKPITLICPCPQILVQGQYWTTFTRVAEKHLGQPIIIEGPRGTVLQEGIERMARREAPDGHVIAVLPIPIFRLPHFARVRWDPLTDFTYIIGIAASTFGVVVKSDSQFKTLQNLIDFAKENPGRLFYGASQRGSTAHLAMEELGFKTGARFQPVHSTNANIVESVKALAEGRIMAISDNTEWGPYVDAGTHRLLATFGELRSRWNAPTTRELGFNVLAYSPFGIVAPRGLDPKLTKLLHDTFKRALDDPEYDKLLRQFELVDWYKSSEDYAEWAVDQFKFQRDLLKRTGIIR